MTRYAALLACAVAVGSAVGPAAAEDGDMDEGLDLLGQGTQLLLRGLMQEIEPALRDLEPRLQELTPFLLELQSVLPEIHLYHLPEILDNGDILIRRKTPEDEIEVGPDGEIEL